MGTQREKKEPLAPMSSLKIFINQEARTMAPFVMKVAKLESIEILYIEIAVNQA